jgi:hypothetical protein
VATTGEEDDRTDAGRNGGAGDVDASASIFVLAFATEIFPEVDRLGEETTDVAEVVERAVGLLKAEDGALWPPERAERVPSVPLVTIAGFCPTTACGGSR